MPTEVKAAQTPAASAAAAARSTSYRPDVDGLRAIAVVAVLAYHLFPASTKGGFVGVDIFFVISGFLISGIILKALTEGSFTFRNFYERRIKRIFPALAAVLAACFVTGWAVMLAPEFKAFCKHLIGAVAFASNIVFWRESGYFDTAAELKPLLHLWSLGVEEQFYLVWPLALVWIHRRKHGLVWMAALGLISFAANIVLTRRAPSSAFYLPVGRLWELIIGSALAYYGALRATPFVRNILSTFGIGLVLGAIWRLGAPGFPGWPALMPAMGTVLLIAAGPDAWFNRMVLSRRCVVLIGLISYPLYLWHWPLLSFSKIVSRQSSLTSAAVAVLSFALAWLTYQLIERPIRFGPPVGWKPILLIACMIVIGAGGLIAYRTEGSIARLGANPFAADLADPYVADRKPCPDPVKRIEPALNICNETIGGEPVAAVFGDSHADSVFRGIARADRARNWLLIGNSSCPPLNGVSVRFKLDTTNLLQCQERIEASTRFLMNSKTIRTVVLAFYGSYFLDSDLAADHLLNHYGPTAVSMSSTQTNLVGKRDLFFRGLDETVSLLLGSGKKVVVVIDTPELPFFPRKVIRMPVDLLGSRSLSRSSVLARQAELREGLRRVKQRHPELVVFDPLIVLCGTWWCPIVEGDTLLYKDSHHLSTRGSKFVADSLLAALDSGR